MLCVIMSGAAGLKAEGTLRTQPDLMSNSSCRVASGDFAV